MHSLFNGTSYNTGSGRIFKNVQFYPNPIQPFEVVFLVKTNDDSSVTRQGVVIDLLQVRGF